MRAHVAENQFNDYLEHATNTEHASLVTHRRRPQRPTTIVHQRLKRACLRRRDPKAWQRFEKTGKRCIHTYTHFPRMLPCSWCWTGLFQSIFDTMCCNCRPRSNGGRPTMTCDNDLDATCFKVRIPVYSLLRTLGLTLEHV